MLVIFLVSHTYSAFPWKAKPPVKAGVQSLYTRFLLSRECKCPGVTNRGHLHTSWEETEQSRTDKIFMRQPLKKLVIDTNSEIAAEAQSVLSRNRKIIKENMDQNKR